MTFTCYRRLRHLSDPAMRDLASRSCSWQKRYYDRNLRSYPDFMEKLRYIHRNPVARGLAQRPADWRWSSFRHDATGEDCGVEIESEWTARKRQRPGKAPHLPAQES